MEALRAAPRLDELLDRIVQMEARLHKTEDCLVSVIESIEKLQLGRVADYHNQQIDQKLEQYENRNKPKA